MVKLDVLTFKAEKGRDFIQFHVESNRPITRDEAMDLQEKMGRGYLVAGYGFTAFHEHGSLCGNALFATSWRCLSVCD